MISKIKIKGLLNLTIKLHNLTDRFFITFRYIICLAMLSNFPISLSLAETHAEAPNLKEVIEGNAETSKPAAATPAIKASETATATAKVNKLAKVGPDDALDRGVPRTSLEGYFKAVKANDLETAIKFLDTRKLPKSYSKKDKLALASQLKVVLDRELWVDMELLSTDPHGHTNDGLPKYRDLVGQIKVEQKHYDILLQRVPRGDGVYIWQFSSQTVRDIPVLYKTFGYGQIGEKLSSYFPPYKALGLFLWQWVFLLLISLSAMLVLYPFTHIASWFITRKANSSIKKIVGRFIRGPLFFAIVIIITRNNFDLISPSLTARAFFDAGTLAVFVGIWLSMGIVSIFREIFTQRFEKRGLDNAVVLLRPAATAINIIIFFIGVLIWLDNIGFRVTTVLAGLGIGGIALALATQKSIEDFIGALTLYLSAPVKVGDFCRFGNKTGTVEEIGLRATKIRTLEDTVITIPNSEFSSTQIENLAERKRFRFYLKLPLCINTTPDQIRYIVLEFKRLLHAYQMVDEAPIRVTFIGIDKNAWIIEIHCYLKTNDTNIFKIISEDLNLRFMDIVNTAGVNISINSMMEYQGNSIESDTKARKLVEQKIDSLRKAGNLSMDLSDAEIENIKDSIQYPGDQAKMRYD